MFMIGDVEMTLSASRILPGHKIQEVTMGLLEPRSHKFAKVQPLVW